jgi:hypothetical protein
MKIVMAVLLRCALLGFVLANTALAGTDRQRADGIMVYLGVVPAEVVLGHAPQHPEAQMHGGPPEQPQRYHVMVALFEAASGARISNATVTARVSELALAVTEKRLELMTIAGAATYGNYFPMSNAGPYRIEVRIRRPGVAGEVQTTFNFERSSVVVGGAQ